MIFSTTKKIFSRRKIIFSKPKKIVSKAKQIFSKTKKIFSNHDPMFFVPEKIFSRTKAILLFTETIIFVVEKIISMMKTSFSGMKMIFCVSETGFFVAEMIFSADEKSGGKSHLLPTGSNSSAENTRIWFPSPVATSTSLCGGSRTIPSWLARGPNGAGMRQRGRGFSVVSFRLQCRYGRLVRAVPQKIVPSPRKYGAQSK